MHGPLLLRLLLVHRHTVHQPALLPHQAPSLADEHVERANLLHRLGELVLPQRVVPGERLHHGPRLRVLDQRVVGGEEPPPGEQLGVVRVVEPVPGHRVEAHLGRALRVFVRVPRRARLPEPLGELRVQRRVHVRGVGETADPVGEHEAVRAGEHDQVLLRQAALREQLREARDVVPRHGEVAREVLHVGALAVLAPRRDVVAGQAGGHGSVARREGQDVRARHLARARGLEGRLCRVNGVQADEGEPVRRRLLLRDVAGGRHVQKDGGVAALT
jgi:hypothetical protein